MATEYTGNKSIILSTKLTGLIRFLVHYQILHFSFASHIVIALPTIATAIVVAIKGDSEEEMLNYCSFSLLKAIAICVLLIFHLDK